MHCTKDENPKFCNYNVNPKCLNSTHTHTHIHVHTQSEENLIHISKSLSDRAKSSNLRASSQAPSRSNILYTLYRSQVCAETSAPKTSAQMVGGPVLVLALVRSVSLPFSVVSNEKHSNYAI